jgi:signal transduction histidine kinase
VSVTVRRNGGNVDITVADTGCGMSPEFVRDHLFRPFDSTKGSQGMGIGAYQAREFAREMGGEIRVQSVVGEGTRISLTLPFE